MPVNFETLTQFNLTPREARLLQEQISPMVIRRDQMGPLRMVAGADIALREKTGYAAFIVYSFPELEEVERAWSTGELELPYVPGLLAFREIPLLLQAFQKLKCRPDLILADAHGWAHPRRAGMACHRVSFWTLRRSAAPSPCWWVSMICQPPREVPFLLCATEKKKSA